MFTQYTVFFMKSNLYYEAKAGDCPLSKWNYLEVDSILDLLPHHTHAVMKVSTRL